MARVDVLSIVYVTALIGGALWLKKRRSQRGLWWAAGCTGVFFIILGALTASAWFLVPSAFWGIFYLSWRREKRALLNGLLFNLFLVSFGLYVVYQAITITAEGLRGALFLAAVVLVPGIVVAFALVFGIYALVVFLLGNSIVMLKREKHRLANMLTLFAALLCTVLIVVRLITGDGARPFPGWVNVCLMAVSLNGVYYFLVFWNFLTSSILYRFIKPAFNQDYVIVLGAGLTNGNTVSPLLARRVDRAIQFCRDQYAKTHKQARLVMSGGRGADEQVAEAEAMRAYAVAQGVPAELILLEDQSATTLENMCFSRRVIEADAGGNGYHALFASNDYHVFRAALLARQSGLKAEGIGAKTAKYYLPNAFLRECIAAASYHRTRHLMVSAALTVLSVLFAIIQRFFVV